ncbi:LpqB family beta-propeller domain-containing protein [Micromonospora sp. NPDC000207]|uniref:LpqB family beta-propeller domain-containing protein n=1 Tax=Micromonospora sp. NPDC000207 TaxID=3154246 RepID=UPI00332DA5FA
MRSHRIRLLAAGCVGVLLAGLSGCGIPNESEVQVDERRPSVVANGSSLRRDEPPNRTSAGTDPDVFVRNFLSAAAGEPDRAYQRVKQFIDPAERDRLQEKQGSEIGLTVVRLRDEPVITTDVESTKVRIAVQQIGLLRANGTLVPPVATESEYQFELNTGEREESNGLYVRNPPNVLLLSDTALREFYQSETIYFWNSDRSRLVPDQRYLPLAVAAERRVTDVVRWLTAGPSDWLGPGVSRLPDGTSLINNATESDGRWEVNLTMSGEDDDRLDQLATQLAWSLPELQGTLELKIRNQTRRVIDSLREHRLSHPAYPISDSPQRFCLYDGVIQPLAFAGEPSGTVPVVTSANQRAVSAALARSGDQVLAALVLTGADGRYRLGVGSGPTDVKISAASAPFTSTGQPVWLRSAAPDRPHGLVAAEGKLYRFDAEARMEQVPLLNVAGRVTAVAAALDGHRIAVIAGGMLYVAAVNLDGGQVNVGPARQISTSLTALTAVDWGGENSLVVAGSGGRPAIYETSVDGALETPRNTDVGGQVTHLAAYPVNPVVSISAGTLMYEANGVAYRSNPFERIKQEQVLVPPPTNGATAGNPTAPFFLY